MDVDEAYPSSRTWNVASSDGLKRWGVEGLWMWDCPTITWASKTLEGRQDMSFRESE